MIPSFNLNNWYMMSWLWAWLWNVIFSRQFKISSTKVQRLTQKRIDTYTKARYRFRRHGRITTNESLIGPLFLWCKSHKNIFQWMIMMGGGSVTSKSSSSALSLGGIDHTAWFIIKIVKRSISFTMANFKTFI